MKKLYIILIGAVTVALMFLIRLNEQKVVLINSSFLKIYTQLSAPEKWENWRQDIAKAVKTYPEKINIKKDSTGFNLHYAGSSFIAVKIAGNTFIVNETYDDKSVSYEYMIDPESKPNNTAIVVIKNTCLWGYVSNLFSSSTFTDTHIDEFKNFMETDSLFYGFRVFKTSVPEGSLAVVRKVVMNTNEFSEAKNSLNFLKSYIKLHGLKQMQPVIAQYISKPGTDSTMVNVGFFVDKPFISDKQVYYTQMPKGGPLYSVNFKGKFTDRQKGYDAISGYLNDHNLQTAIAPFETYFGDKLPSRANDTVSLRINFSSYR